MRRHLRFSLRNLMFNLTWQNCDVYLTWSRFSNMEKEAHQRVINQQGMVSMRKLWFGSRKERSFLLKYLTNPWLTISHRAPQSKRSVDSMVLGCLSNHDDDGNKKPTNLHIWQWKTVFLHALHVHFLSFDILKTFSFFLRREMTCFIVVWTMWAYDDKCSILSSYFPSASSN